MQPANLISTVLLQSDVSHQPPTASPESQRSFPRWKRSLDVACGLTALPVLGCTTLVAAVVTTLTSPGPLLFRESTQGENGRHFGMYRFRTRHVTSPRTESTAGVKTKAPYIVGGQILHRTGFVKLPQLINVLRGEMTIVGRRPDAHAQSGSSTPTLMRVAGERPGIIMAETPGLTSGGGLPPASFGAELRFILKSAAGGLSGILRQRGDSGQAK